MESTTLYTTGCPKCRVLETKLTRKGIAFEKCTDTDRMMQKGFKSLPVLEADGREMGFLEAVEWVNAK